MSETYKCKQCPKRFTINEGGDCSEIKSPIKPRRNVGKYIKNAIFGIGLLIGGACLANMDKPVSAAPIVAVAKPVKAKVHHHAKKKCACSCKKKLTKPIQHYKTNVSDTPDIEEIEARLTTVEERIS